MNYLVTFSRIFVGVLFIISGLIKLNDPVGTAIKLEEYFQVFAADFGAFFKLFIPASLFLAMVLNVLEVALGLAVLIKYRIKLVLWVLLGMIVFFTFLTFYSAHFNKVTDCGCFGDAIKLTPWESFFKDIVLLLFIGILFVFRKRLSRHMHYPQRDGLMIGLVVLLTLVGYYAIQHLPYIDFRAYKVGTHIPTAMKPSEQLRYKYIMTKNGTQFEFEKYPSDESYEFKELVVLNPEAQPKITDYSVWNDEGDFTQETFQGNKLLIIIHSATDTDLSSYQDINQLLATLGSNIEPLVLTASDYTSIEELRHEVQLAVPYFYADMTVLKTMVRSNPGLMLLQNGVVKGKWHHNDIPSVADINELLSP